MKQIYRCKACGFLMESDKPAEICPACGVPKTAFEPYRPNLSEKRRKMLNLHIHPILLHFPQAFTVLGLFLLILIPVVSEPLKAALIPTAAVILTLLPFTVAAGLLSGLYDGKLRFKKTSTPILKGKILLGSSFFVFTAVCTILIHVTDFASGIPVGEIILLLLSTACSVLLGKMGGALLESKLPG